MGLLSLWAESLAFEYEVLKSCTHYRSPRSKCKKCVESCTRNAISFINGIPSINNEQCTQCGDCIAVCSVQAVAGIFPARAVRNHQMEITEEKPPTAKELLVYYKKGITKISFEGELPENCRKSIEEANVILQLLGETPFTLINEKFDATTIEMTRRDLFFNWKKDVQTLMVKMAPAKWRFNQDDLELAKYYPEHQFSEIRLDSLKCSLCKACEFLCPKKCLQITDTGFFVNGQSCSSCRLCEDICPEKAITVQEKISSRTTLCFPVFTKFCTECNRSYHTLTETDQICVSCAKRKGFLGAS